MARNSGKLRIMVLWLIAMFSTASLSAQDLKKAIGLSESEQFIPAHAIYEKLLKSEPQNGDVYYYYGESYLKSYFTDTANVDLKEMTQKAKTLFEKGISVDANNPMNYIGLGKAALYSGDYPGAASQFQKAESLIPTGKLAKTNPMPLEKQITVFNKIAEGYIKAEKKDTGLIFSYLRKAEKLDKKNPEMFLLRGDGYLFSLNDGSNAIVNYKRAQDLDPKSPKAKLRLGQLWVRAKRYQDALGYYKEAIEVDSTFAPAYRERAELYAMAGQYENAKSNYKKFLDLSNGNIGAMVRYASFLFLTKNYDDAIKQIKEILAQDESFNFLNRLAAYSYYETGKAEDAKKYIDVFFSKTSPEKIIPSDYHYQGKIFAKLGQDSLAILKYQKSYSMDTSNVDVLSDMISSYNKMKKYNETARVYLMKVAKKKATLQDYYALGKAYYNAAEWGKADTALTYVITTKPDFLPAYLWKARVYSNLDPETKEGLAKPHYELFIQKAIVDSVKNAKDLVEAYSYLGYYFLKNKKYTESMEFWQKVVAIDPNNERAKGVIKDLKSRGIPGK